MSDAACITFVIPLKSPQVCTDWDKVSRLCMRTLGSLKNQTSPNWRCILVCNEPPIGLNHVDNVSVVQVDRPTPGNHRERMADKGTKKRHGLEALTADQTRYVMCLDADDLLHRDLVRYVAEQEADSGWIIAKGYEYGGGQIAVRKRGQFDQKCGSCSILPHQELLQDPSPFMLSHSKVREFYRSIKRPLRELPMYGAMHILDTGENNSGRSAIHITGFRSTLRLIKNATIVTPRLQHTFGLWPRQV